MQQQVTVAMPLLEAVEHAALRAGVPVDARVESGRTPIHALQRLWDVEHFDRIVVPAPAGRERAASSPKDLTWMLTHAPSETLILRPDPARLAGSTRSHLRRRTPVPFPGQPGWARTFSFVSQTRRGRSCDERTSLGGFRWQTRTTVSHPMTRSTSSKLEEALFEIRRVIAGQEGMLERRARLPARRRPPADRGRPRPRQDADDQDDGLGARRLVQARPVHAGPRPERPRRHARSSVPTSTTSTPSSARSSATSCSPTRSTARRRRCSRRCSR